MGTFIKWTVGILALFVTWFFATIINRLFPLFMLLYTFFVIALPPDVFNIWFIAPIILYMIFQIPR